ncbi:MAG TPA: prepilin-type N-terminal cleavage/methylation domain-containing protein [Kofleriaceae bacterium]|nr:prepilin-type N-terminal cleavage/methylation domain-containing protein [Kofleriaceae bacterium]
MRTGATKGQRGFTLLELLITLSVTTIGLIGLLSLHLSVTRGNDGASRSAEAQQIGAGILEGLRAQSATRMMGDLTGSQASVPPVVAPVITVTGRAGMTFTVARSVTALTGASTNLWKIRVVTSWAEDGGTFGSNGGTLDHSLALEVVRTVEEAL